jgi:predicted metal-dependent peptidase
MNASALENAVVRLLKKRPFYGLFILNLHREISTGDRPIGVTIREGTPTLTVNEKLFGEFAPAGQEALLEHCVRHLLHLHMVRRKGRNSHCWDICCDIAINPSIEGMPGGSPQPADYRAEHGLAAEEYYALLVPRFDIGNLSGHGTGSAIRDVGGKTGSGEGDAQHHSSGPVDDHACWQESDSTPVRLAEEMVRSIVRETRKRCDGEVPAEIRDLVAGLLSPAVIPWRQLLRQFVATAGRVGRKSSWLREHRRFQHDTPGTRKRHRLNLLVGVDVSDSTNIIELRESFAKELMGIARGQDSLLTVLYANSRIQRIESLKGEGVRLESYHGGGFTDLRPVFDYARTMRPLPAAIIYLTDGYGEAPEHMEFPTLWVLTSDGEKPAPWGVELRLEV